MKRLTVLKISDIEDWEIQAFNPEKVTDKIIEFIRKYYKNNNLTGVVLGISGGKDSAVVAALFCKALGPENVVGFTLPCHSMSSDRADAIIVSETFGFELYNFDLTPVYDAWMKELSKLGDFTEEELKNSEINLKPRLRMASNYFFGALLSARRKGTYIVAGTSNKCENYVGYFTKGGDSVYDIGVLNNLTVDEVIAIGEYLGVPDEIIHKTPSDGLSGMSDEEKLGVSYKDIASFMNGENVDERVSRKIRRLHSNAAHKFYTPIY